MRKLFYKVLYITCFVGYIVNTQANTIKSMEAWWGVEDRWINVTEKYSCIGKQDCNIHSVNRRYLGDPYLGKLKRLYIHAKCSKSNRNARIYVWGEHGMLRVDFILEGFDGYLICMP